MTLYWLIFGVFMILSLVVSNTLQARFKKYSKEPLINGMTGRDVAEKMLRDNGINDVRVVSVKGHLTDFYNPRTKTVNLSESVYGSCSVSAAAVAAHECGHAVQHATDYAWLKLRSFMVPAVQFGSNLSPWILLGGMALLQIGKYAGLWLIALGIGLFAITTIFSLVTLPVEYNASDRALQWLNATRIASGTEYEHAKDALKWAARTYLVAALSSLATLLYYIFMFMGRRD